MVKGDATPRDAQGAKRFTRRQEEVTSVLDVSCCPAAAAAAAADADADADAAFARADEGEQRDKREGETQGEE